MLLQVLLALAAVIVTGQILARLLARFGQPPVVGEVLAGILLGPSLLGAAVSARILPPDIAPVLGGIAQAGIVAYMFFVGLELDAAHLRARRGTIATIAWTSVLVPFALGAMIAVPIHRGHYTSAGLVGFSLFMGVALSVTAFPVLARIIRDRGMERTEIGAIALAAAALADIIIWCLLAVIVGITAGQAFKSFAIVGAFLAGAVLHVRGERGRRIVLTLERGVAMLLLPAFFAFTGMRTRIDLLSGAGSWVLCGLIIAAAVAGKFAGAVAGAKLARLTWRDASIVGILMNTRGLMELIVLNIGLELGILSPELFAMMVLMALATTMMTGPLLRLAKVRSGAAG